MKITIAPVIAGPAWGTEVDLTAGLYASPERLIYNGSTVVDMVQVLDSASQTAIDRGNQASSITFTFTNDNTSFNDSEQNLILYFAMIPSFGKITFYAEGALSTPYAYMIASVNMSHSQIGVATIRNFTLTGTPISTTEPGVPAFSVLAETGDHILLEV